MRITPPVPRGPSLGGRAGGRPLPTGPRLAAMTKTPSAPAKPPAERIRGLYPPGGYANAIGVHLAALDHGLAEVKVRARRVPAGKAGTRVAPVVRSPLELVVHVGDVEA